MIGTALQIIRWLATQKPEQMWEIKKHTKKRTLSQNAYYWQLCGQLADVLRLPKSVVHNNMLRAYGQAQGIDGRLVTVTIPDTEKAWKQALMAETFHVKPTSQVRLGSKNQMFRTYVLLKGSHELTTEEMSVLVDGIVQEAQEQGIETLTPAELERMRSAEHNAN